MREQLPRGTKCHICTGCGRCFGGGREITILTEGGLLQDWQRKIQRLSLERLERLEKKLDISRREGDLMERDSSCWLIAVDLGTTTIAMLLYDGQGKERGHFVKVNPQVRFGADVISRISAAKEPGASAWMQESVCSVLREGVEYFRKIRETSQTEEAADRGIEDFHMLLAGNTAMLYLLQGLDPEELGQAPFEASHLDFAQMLIAGVPTLLLPGLSAFVGADILSGLYACQMQEQKELTLFIDLGTNGEMALGNRDRIIACSTAAAPAFEGGAATGVWGADVVSLTARLLGEGVLDETGLLRDPYFETGIRIGGISLDQKQIRNLQLAKAAVAAGIKTLISLYGLETPEKIERVILAGGFGYYLNPEDAARIGLIPKGLVPKVISAGNAALAGILRCAFQLSLENYRENHGDNVKYLRENFQENCGTDIRYPRENFQKNCCDTIRYLREAFREIRQKTEVVNLAQEKLFADSFIAAMNLEEWE